MSDVQAAEAAENTLPPDVADDVGYEDRARLMGWKPKAEFKGDPERWTDARTFVDRGEKILPIVLERNRALEDKLGKQGDQLSEMKQKLNETASAFMEYRDFARQAEERAFVRAKKELEARMNAAVDTADRDSYMRAKAELDALEPPPPAAQRQAGDTNTQQNRQPPPPTQPTDPAVQEWIGENQWFSRDPTLAAYATSYHGQLLRDKPGLSIRDNLTEVRQEVMARFPEKFGNPKRQTAAAVTTPAPSGSRRKSGKSYDDLPPEAKTACDKFVAQINAMKPKSLYTREEYVKTYFAGEE